MEQLLRSSIQEHVGVVRRAELQQEQALLVQQVAGARQELDAGEEWGATERS